VLSKPHSFGDAIYVLHAFQKKSKRAGNFSVERLMDFLVALGQDVEITVRPTRKHHGQVSVVLP
jgi:hypothetical protein